jgi:ribosomal protein S19
MISYNFLDKKVFINNGRHLKSLNILSNMIGYKFGEFILVKTSKSYIHLKKSKKKTKKIK